MAEIIPTIYRFTNATLIDWNGSYRQPSISLFDGGSFVQIAMDVLSVEIMNKLNRSRYSLYERTGDELQLISSSWSQEVVSYVPSSPSSGLRDLTEEEYEKLSPGFQKHYSKELSEPVETRTTLKHELKVLDFELKETVLLGQESLSELHAMVLAIRESARRSSSSWYGRNEEPRPELTKNLPLELTGTEILAVIGQLGRELGQSVGYRAMVTHREYHREPNYLEISFLAAPYEGAMRKVLDKKQNGQPYADRRGRMVKDLPKVVGKAVVTKEEVMLWWKSIGGPSLSDDAKLEALKIFTRHLWRF